MDEGHRIARAVLEVLGQATAPIEPRERALDDPPFGQGDEAFDLLTTCDDLGCQLRPYFRHALSKLRPLIGPIREQLGQQRKTLGERREQLNPSVTILNIRGMHARLQDQPQGIDSHVALFPFDLFARIKPRWINVCPPFSALFTL